MSQVTTPPPSLSNGLDFVDGVYRTAPRKTAFLARTFPSLTFFPQLHRSIFRGSSIAKRGGYDDQAWINTSMTILRALEGVGCQFEITGLDNFDKFAGPCLIVGNHISSLETGVLPAIIRPLRPVTFVVKQSLLDYPVFRHVMRARRPIAVTQTNPRADLKTMLEEGAKRLAEGTSIIVFPQGARRASFDSAEFNSIGVKLAQRSNVPIVPLALMTAAWPLGKLVTDFGRIEPNRKVRMAFGEPMTIEGRGGDANARLISYIESHLQRWDAEDRRNGPR